MKTDLSLIVTKIQKAVRKKTALHHFQIPFVKIRNETKTELAMSAGY